MASGALREIFDSDDDGEQDDDLFSDTNCESISDESCEGDEKAYMGSGSRSTWTVKVLAP